MDMVNSFQCLRLDSSSLYITNLSCWLASVASAHCDYKKNKWLFLVVKTCCYSWWYDIELILTFQEMTYIFQINHCKNNLTLLCSNYPNQLSLKGSWHIKLLKINSVSNSCLWQIIKKMVLLNSFFKVSSLWFSYNLHVDLSFVVKLLYLW